MAMLLLQGPTNQSPLPGGVHALVEGASLGVEVAGVATIVLGAVFAAGVFFRGVLGGAPFSETYHHLRGNLGRAILLGLELLVAADIMASVTLELSLERLGALALLIVIRTFLSFSLEVEIDGHWPWKDSEFRDRPRENKL